MHHNANGLSGVNAVPLVMAVFNRYCGEEKESRECNTQACEEATPTPTPEDEGEDDDNGGTGGQTESPTPTEIPTPTPTSADDSGTSNDDISNSSNDSNSSSSSSDDSSNDNSSVLGATIMADTGSVNDLYMMLGLILTAASAYAYKCEKKEKRV